MNRITARTILSSFILLAAVPAYGFGPASGKITYQGQLKLGPTAVDEPCEAIFTLYDAETGGNIIGEAGSAAAPVPLQVNRGLFTVPLDFGSAAFNGDERWLEVSVRLQSTGGVFTTLSPRQCMTAAPYALHAKTGGEVSLDQAYNKGGPGAGRTIQASSGPLSIDGPDGLRVNGNVGIGVANPTAKLEVAGMIHSTSGGIKFPDGTLLTSAGASALLGATTFWDDNTTDKIFTSAGVVGVGIGTINPLVMLDVDGDVTIRPPGTLTVDTINSASPMAIQSDGVTGIFLDGTPTTGTPGFVAIGRTTPQEIPASLLHLAANAENPIITLEMDPNNLGTPATRFAGLQFLTSNGAANTVLGNITLEEASGSLFLAADTGDVILAELTGNVGVGTDAPTAKLEVNGSLKTTSFQMTAGATNGFVLTSDAAGNASWTTPTAPPTGPAGGDLTGTYPNPDIAPNAVTSAEIADNSVGNTEMADNAIGNVEMADNAIGNAEMADNAVGSAEIIDDSIAAADIGPNAVGNSEMADNAVGNAEMADNAVGSAEIIDDSVAAVDIGPNAIGNSEMADNAIGSAEIIDASITGADLGPNVVDTANIADNAITNAKMADNSVGSAEIIDNSVAAVDLASDPLSLNKVSGGVMQSTGGNIDIPAPGMLFVNTVSSHSPLELSTDAPVPTVRVHINDGTVPAVAGFVGIGTLAPGQLLDVAGGNIRTNQQLISTVPIGTAPLAVTSTTLVTNLNADLLDGLDETAFVRLLGRSGLLGQSICGGDATAPGVNLTLDSTCHGTKGDVIIQPLGGDTLINPVSANAGNVGIGIGLPTEKLHVVGNTLITGDASVNGTVFTTKVSRPAALPLVPLELQIDGNPRIRIQPDGRVGIGAPPPAVVDPAAEVEVAGCVKAFCFIATNTTGIPVSALKLVKLGTSGITLNPTLNGTMIVRPSATGQQTVMLPLDLPTQLLGTTQKLATFRICYRTTNGASPITAVRVKQVQDNGTAAVVFNDTTTRSSAVFTCDPFDPPDTPLSGPTYLELTLNFIGTGILHDIEIGKVTADLTN